MDATTIGVDLAKTVFELAIGDVKHHPLKYITCQVVPVDASAL